MQNITDIREYKNSLRRKYKAMRERMSTSFKNSLDERIFERIVSSSTYIECEMLLTFVSTAIEVDTKRLINQALADGKIVAVPRCVTGTRNMEFYQINSMDDLEPGAFGVLEPIVEKCNKITEFGQALNIIPGLAFDLKGYRLGYGKGYYDRFLSAHPSLKNFGICYCCCTLNNLIHGKFDIAVECLITEKYMKTF